MKPKSILFVILLFVIPATITWAEATGSGENLLTNASYFWSGMNHDGKILYVQGVIVGLYATYEEMKRSGRSDVASRVEDIIPWNKKIDDIIAVIDHAYQFPRFKDIPIWYMVIEIETVLRDLEEKGDL